MKVSIITWDASFRESFHIIRFFNKQENSPVEYEFIWIDYYTPTQALENKIKGLKNFKAIGLGHNSDEKWHLGKCINAGVKHSTGDLLIIPDGDIVVEADFINYCLKEHSKIDSMALYFRRYDEPKEFSSANSQTDIEHLKQHSKITNPTNYAGCLTLKRSVFDAIGGYETHKAFSGPGMNGLDTYIRLRNMGVCIKWADYKIYHPCHQSTGSNLEDNVSNKILRSLTSEFPWIKPYGGIAQSWIILMREFNLESKASEKKCDLYLKSLPDQLKRLIF